MTSDLTKQIKHTKNTAHGIGRGWQLWQAWAMSVGVVFVFLLLQLLIFLLLKATLMGLDTPSLVVSSTIVTAFFMVGLVWVLAFWLSGRQVAHLIGAWRFDGKAFIKGLGAVLGVTVVGWALGVYLDKTPTVFMDELVVGQSWVGLFWLFLLVVVIAPIYEELVFRGLVFGVLYHAKSEAHLWHAILLSSALFALVHLQYDWFGFLWILVLAAVLAWVRYRSGSILLPILLHVINNALALLVYWLGRV